MKELTYEEWFDKYQPIKNHLDDNSSYDGYMFETFGKEIEFITHPSIHPSLIWTLIEGDYGDRWIIPGYHLVNRLGYFYSEIPCNDKNIQVNDNEMVTINKAESLFIEYCDKNSIKIDQDDFHEFLNNNI